MVISWSQQSSGRPNNHGHRGFLTRCNIQQDQTTPQENIVTSPQPLPSSLVLPFISACADRPARPRITVVPNITYPKQKGEWAESFFETCALALNFNCAKPAGDSAPFDRIVEHHGNMLRVQVKSAWESERYGYFFNTAPFDKSITYTDEHIDIFAGLVVPEDAWYIIPVAELPRGKKHLAVYPAALPNLRDKLGRRIGSRRQPKYEKFRECWHLLKLPARVLRKLRTNPQP